MCTSKSHHRLLHRYLQAMMLKKKMPRITETCSTITLLQLLLMNYLNFEKRKNNLRAEFKVIIIIFSVRPKFSSLLKVVGFFHYLVCYTRSSNIFNSASFLSIISQFIESQRIE